MLPADFLTTTDVARILDTSNDTVRRLERQGVLPAVRTAGGVRIFDRTRVEQLAEQRRLAKPMESDRR